MRRVALGVLVGVSLAACLGDPVGPRGMLVVQHMGGSDSALVGAPGRALPQPIQFRLLDGAGRPVPGATVHWSAVAGGGRIAESDLTTREDGTFAARWELGTRAGDAQKLSTEVVAGGHHAVAEVSAVAVPVEVTALTLQAETTEVRLAVRGQVRAVATDPFGNQFVPKDLHFNALDTAVVVDSTGGVLARHRGFARVVATVSGHADTAVVHAIQVVASIQVDRDTLRFHSLGQGQQVGVSLVDDQGLVVADSFPAVTASDPTIVAIQSGASLVVQSVANGIADVQLQAGTVSRQVIALVRQRTATLEFSGAAPHFDALKDTIRPTLVILDSLGVPVQSPRIAFWSGDSAVALIDSMGLVVAVGNGTGTLFGRSASGVLASIPVTVKQMVTQLTASKAALQFDALNATLPIGVVPRDRLGSPVPGAAVRYTSADSSVAAIDAGGTIQARRNGSTVLTAVWDSVSTPVAVTVTQRPVQVRGDTLRFDALADTQTITAVALDSLGSQVSGSVTNLSISDAGVAESVDSVRVRSLANGTTTASVTVAGIAGEVVVEVKQVAASISAAVTFGKSIVTVSRGAQLPIQCQALDANGYILPTSPSILSATGVITGRDCSTAVASRSGFDTVEVSSGAVSVAIPLVVAAAPSVDAPAGEFLEADSLPAVSPWAPSARINSIGRMEVYFAGGYQDSVTGTNRSQLHRLVSNDGIHFAYDGVALQHDDDPCALNGTGVENVSIVPRADTIGWRMYYASGSNDCYGWQVFSAVSSDERTWIKEPGVRLSNGGPLPPVSPQTPPWAVGEGMAVDRLPSGEWRMIAGTFEHLLPAPENLWQIAEWTSTDQMNWTYVTPVLTTRDLPSPWQGSVYSPTIRQVVPGIWRILFTADNRHSGLPFASTIWSAVSTDKEHWQIEGQLLGDVGTNLYYSALAGERLIFLRQDAGGPIRLGVATVTMP